MHSLFFYKLIHDVLRTNAYRSENLLGTNLTHEYMTLFSQLGAGAKAAARARARLDAASGPRGPKKATQVNTS